MKILKIIIVLMLVVFFMMTIKNKTSANPRICASVTDEMVKEDIRENFLAGIQNSPFELEALGSTNPKIKWGEVGRTQDITNKTLSVPFLAKGVKGNLNMIGIYTCSDGRIEYSVDK